MVKKISEAIDILFLLYIHDIIRSSNLLNFVVFADDTNTFIDHHNLNTLMYRYSEHEIKITRHMVYC